MTEIKEEIKESKNERKLFAETRGRYSVLDNNKLYQYDFPMNANLEENYTIVKFLEEELLKAIEKQKEEKEPKKEPEKEAKE